MLLVPSSVDLKTKQFLHHQTGLRNWFGLTQQKVDQQSEFLHQLKSSHPRQHASVITQVDQDGKNEITHKK